MVGQNPRKLIWVLALLSLLLTACSRFAAETEVETQVQLTPAARTALSWRQTTASPTPLYEAQGLAVNGVLYVFGGYYNSRIQATDKAYAFNPRTKRWRQLARLPEKITHAGQAAYGSKIYLAGGFVGDHPGPTTDRLWVYDTRRNRWSRGPSLPEKRGAGALVQSGGKLHFFGGASRTGYRYHRDSRDHWVLDLAGGSRVWRPAAPMPKSRNHLAGVALNGVVYALGGQRLGNESSGNLRYVHAYDPKTNRWRQVANLPYRVGHITASSFAHGGKLVVTGGVTQGRRKLRNVIAYDPKTNRWSQLTPLPQGRSSSVSSVIDGTLYVTTGMQGVPQTTTWAGRWHSP